MQQKIKLSTTMFGYYSYSGVTQKLWCMLANYAKILKYLSCIRKQGKKSKNCHFLVFIFYLALFLCPVQAHAEPITITTETAIILVSAGIDLFGQLLTTNASSSETIIKQNRKLIIELGTQLQKRDEALKAILDKLDDLPRQTQKDLKDAFGKDRSTKLEAAIEYVIWLQKEVLNKGGSEEYNATELERILEEFIVKRREAFELDNTLILELMPIALYLEMYLLEVIQKKRKSDRTKRIEATQRYYFKRFKVMFNKGEKNSLTNTVRSFGNIMNKQLKKLKSWEGTITYSPNFSYRKPFRTGSRIQGEGGNGKCYLMVLDRETNIEMEAMKLKHIKETKKLLKEISPFIELKLMEQIIFYTSELNKIQQILKKYNITVDAENEFTVKKLKKLKSDIELKYTFINKKIEDKGAVFVYKKIIVPLVQCSAGGIPI